MSEHIANPEALAIGYVQADTRRFHIRRIVWGWAIARAEKRDGEVIRRVSIVGREPTRRKKHG